MEADGSNKRKLAGGGFPEWISDNTIAYVDDGNLYRMTLDGKKELLVKDAVLCYSINNDGAIIYKNRVGISIVYDGKRRELTKSFQDLCPVFSPDGRKIAFTSERTGNADIWMIRWEKKFRLRRYLSPPELFLKLHAWINFFNFNNDCSFWFHLPFCDFLKFLSHFWITFTFYSSL